MVWWALHTHTGISTMDLDPGGLLYSIKKVDIGGKPVLVCAEVPDVCRSVHLSFIKLINGILVHKFQIKSGIITADKWHKIKSFLPSG